MNTLKKYPNNWMSYHHWDNRKRLSWAKIARLWGKISFWVHFIKTGRKSVQIGFCALFPGAVVHELLFFVEKVNLSPNFLVPHICNFKMKFLARNILCFCCHSPRPTESVRGEYPFSGYKLQIFGNVVMCGEIYFQVINCKYLFSIWAPPSDRQN